MVSARHYGLASGLETLAVMKLVAFFQGLSVFLVLPIRTNKPMKPTFPIFTVVSAVSEILYASWDVSSLGTMDKQAVVIRQSAQP